MKIDRRIVSTLLASIPLALLTASAIAEDPPKGPPYKTVSELLLSHDRRLIRDLGDYAAKNPKAVDVEQAYMTIFEKVIEHDWFVDHEKAARAYLAERPDGAVRSLARIVASMARAEDGKFADALEEFRDLIKGLDKQDQEEFASNFADSLATAAVVAGEFDVAKSVYETLIEKYGDNPNLRSKVKDDLGRIAMIGKAAPSPPVRDRAGVTFRLSDYAGKYVLVDFWATWCAPCVADLPNLRAAYKTYHPKGLEVVSVSLDETDAPLSDFLKTHDMPWRHVHNPSGGADLAEAFGVNTIPATFLLGPDGKVIRLELRGAALAKTLGTIIK